VPVRRGRAGAGRAAACISVAGRAAAGGRAPAAEGAWPTEARCHHGFRHGFRYTSRPMQKQAWTWTTPHFPQPARMVRWGHFGAPVLIFPTAGGDFEEIERFGLVAALGSLIDGGRIKVYSVDALAVRARLSGIKSIDDSYDSFLYEDVLPRIRSDCQVERIEPLLVGASLGADTAIRTLCRHPDVFRGAIGLSGIYSDGRDCRKTMSDGAAVSSTSAVSSTRADGHGSGGSSAGADSCGSGVSSAGAISLVTALAVAQIEQLKTRAITLGSGAGNYENPTQSQRLADTFGTKGIPCRFLNWGPGRDHTWSTWRDLLPGLL
jgi:esterase/lipase superfamily enzyme